MGVSWVIVGYRGVVVFRLQWGDKTVRKPHELGLFFHHRRVTFCGNDGFDNSLRKNIAYEKPTKIRAYHPALSFCRDSISRNHPVSKPLAIAEFAVDN